MTATAALVQKPAEILRFTAVTKAAFPGIFDNKVYHTPLFNIPLSISRNLKPALFFKGSKQFYPIVLIQNPASLLCQISSDRIYSYPSVSGNWQSSRTITIVSAKSNDIHSATLTAEWLFNEKKLVLPKKQFIKLKLNNNLVCRAGPDQENIPFILVYLISSTNY